MSRFGRLKGRLKNRKRVLLGIHPLPTMVTLGNLLCGFGSIILAMRASNPPGAYNAAQCIYFAGLLIFVAMIFDVLDGKVARWTKSTSKFGMEMDSLCDVVSFGVAPAVLVKAMIDHDPSFPLMDRYVWPMLATYVCCAALRLARYNVEAETGHRDFFFGMPSPGAAGCAASLALLITPYYERQNPFFGESFHVQSLHRPVLMALPFIMLFLGVLMVSRVQYPHMGDRLLRGKKSFMHMMVLLLAVALIIMQHEIMLALAFNGYMIAGALNEMRVQIFKGGRPVENPENPEQKLPSESGPHPL